MYLRRLLWPSTDLERPWVKCVFLISFFFFSWALASSPCHFIPNQLKMSQSRSWVPAWDYWDHFSNLFGVLFSMCMCALCMYVCMCMGSHISNSVFAHVWRSGVDIGGLRPLSTSYIDSRSVPGARWLAHWASQLAPRIPVLGLQAGD